MEANDERYDVAVSSTIERPEFLLYGNLFGDRRQNSLSLSQTTMETPFSKAQGHSKLNKCPVSTFTVLNFSFRLSPYVIQVILGAVSVIGTIPALVHSSFYVYLCN